MAETKQQKVLRLEGEYRALVDAADRKGLELVQAREATGFRDDDMVWPMKTGPSGGVP